ncbi:uncharacterized protein EV420DRAFT_236003 [Desarmillaria tabescens]|uniref:Transmembrane protein n=1 Tax=Armillaria tabescens TaxID=1929756 RepID=A0AA39J779_ARMTA|nr:uncharacterized protein EV420DRAFT_236003 [Desarmillaria tabescens]KAK0436647.1 hypothetical protein EV420DRAFT_236003 [Desarmillaria tabescens]
MHYYMAYTLEFLLLHCGIYVSQEHLYYNIQADIWCCWMVWGQCWLIVLLPILSLISATVSKIIIIYHDYFNASKPVLFMMLYTSFVLVTTLWCTLLIIFRILTVTGVRHGAGSRLRVYHCFIELVLRRELHPHSLLAEQQQGTHIQLKNMMKVQQCRLFISRHLCNLHIFP